MDILIFIIAGTIGSLFYSLSDPTTDTIFSNAISTGLGTCLAVGVTLILYDFMEKQLACTGVSLLTGALGTDYTSKFGKSILSKLSKENE